MGQRLLVACVLASLGSNIAGAGEIIGRVHYPAGIDGRRSPAVAYLVDSDAPPSEPETIYVDQRDREFVPRVQAMAFGGSIVFRNSDGEVHNVNSQSDCCSFNCMIASASAAGPGTSDPFTPLKPGVLRLLCNIHAQMRGFVVVCPNSRFSVADPQGNFRMKDVPQGTYKLVVWQESSEQISQQIDVTSELRLNLDLRAIGSERGAPVATLRRPVQPWRDVLKQIAGKLYAAATAAKAGAGSDADQLALDAYFECFEASELEAAVLLFRGEERKFDLERMFAKIRRPLLAELASGKGDISRVHQAIAELTKEIEADIGELYAKGVIDRTSLGSAMPAAPGAHRTGADSAVVAQVLLDLRGAFEGIVKLVESGESTAAAGELADCYFQIFHRIEPALAAHNYIQVRQIEGRFLELRGSIRSGLAGDDVRSDLESLWAQIDLAASALTQSNQSGIAAATNRFWNAFVILGREGVEAILIITALLLCLDRSKRPEAKRLIYGGIALALVATLFTWSGLQWLIAQSGVAQETIEGVAALAAGAVLFYVSYWLVSKSEARQWQQFLARQVDRHLSSGSRWAIGLAAFLAVYREGAETILMFQPMLVNPTANELTGTVAGIIAAILALAAVFWGLRFASFRMAIRPFFRVTGVLLFALAVVFAGKGIAELQEARVLTISPLPLGLHSAITAIPSVLRDALGITPNVQSVAIQGTILAGVLLSLASMWLMAPQAAEHLERRGPPSKPESKLVRHSTV